MNRHSHTASPTSRTVLVTGASGAIGHALCLRFAKAGWKIGVHWHGRSEEAQATARAVKERGADASLHQADIRAPHEVDHMIRGFVDSWGPLDVLICNAGTATGTLLIRTRAEDWDRIISTNLSGTFFCMKAAAAHMLERRQGAIVVIGSYAGFHGSEGQAAYAASKAGLVGLVRTAAIEWGPSNIRVNLLLPGWQASRLSDHAMTDLDLRQDHLLKRAPRLSTVAATAYRLACNRETSGQIWNIDSRIL